MSDTDLTLAELRTQALHDDFDASKYSARVNQFINDWLGEIFSTTNLAAADQTATIALVAGTISYPLPATSVRVQEILDQSTNPATPLIELTQEGFDTLPVSTGTPVYFVLNAGNVVLWPTPGAGGSLLLRYRADATALTADGDKPAIPNKYRKVLVAHARAQLFALEDDPAMAASWQGERDAITARLRADLQRRSRRTRQVPRMWSQSAIGR